MKRVAIVGASIGGLVAAGALRERGLDVTILERSKAIGGLYGKVETPFGPQEMGMHVLYAGKDQFRHLISIFGADVFQVLEGVSVDIGGHYNFGKLSLNSIYPDVRHHAMRDVMLDEIRGGEGYWPCRQCPGRPCSALWSSCCRECRGSDHREALEISGP